MWRWQAGDNKHLGSEPSAAPGPWPPSPVPSPFPTGCPRQAAGRSFQGSGPFLLQERVGGVEGGCGLEPSRSSLCPMEPGWPALGPCVRTWPDVP